MWRSVIGSVLVLSASVHADGKDIVDTAVEAGSFKTLVEAVKAAGLVDALKGPGPLTVFAPTDEAFAKLPAGTLDALLKNPAKLRTILKYHVVSGAVKAADVVKLSSAKTLNGQSVAIDASNGVKIDGATVAKADIEASNGIIHVIDTVILPKDDIVDVAAAAGSFKTLLDAADAAGLVDALRGEGPLTVFAPTDEAFAKLPTGTLDELKKDKEKLAAILTYHVVAGKVTAKQAAGLSSAKTLNGKNVSISKATCTKSHETTLSINGANVLKADISAANGVIHVIDKVLLP
jgi:transforming growth factor-beta-induced protein